MRLQESVQISVRKPTADELQGMSWWNNLSERQRSFAMQLAKASSVAEAWDWQKHVRETEGFEVHAAYARFNAASHHEKSWVDGYLAGRDGKPPKVPEKADRHSWVAGIIEGKADRDAGRDYPLSQKPILR